MTGICLTAKFTLMANWEQFGFLLRSTTLGSTITVAAIAYFTATRFLKVEESGEFLALLGRRFGKK